MPVSGPASAACGSGRSPLPGGLWAGLFAAPAGGLRAGLLRAPAGGLRAGLLRARGGCGPGCSALIATP